MRSRSKIDVRIGPENVDGQTKPWASVYSRLAWPGVEAGAKVLVPAFEDLFRILAAIVHCEYLKYPKLRTWAGGPRDASEMGR